MELQDWTISEIVIIKKMHTKDAALRSGPCRLRLRKAGSIRLPLPTTPIEKRLQSV